jgi:PAS domain S-box-containing protein
VVKHGVTEFLNVFQDLGIQFFDLETDLLVMLDDQGNIERVNPAWSRALGYAEADMLGRGLARFVLMDDLSKFLNAFTSVTPQPFRLLHCEHGEVRARLVAWRHQNRHSYIILRSIRG